MLRRLLLMLFLLVTAGATLYAQQGTLKGTIIDKDSKEEIPFAAISVWRDGKMLKSVQSEMDGIFTIKPLEPGKYTVKATAIGYNDVEISGFEVRPTDFSVCDISMTSKLALTTGTVEVIWTEPIITKGEVVTGGVKGADEIEKMPVSNISGITATMPGVSFATGAARGEGGMVSVVNGGVRHSGVNNIPVDAIQEVKVVLGGTPASIGEAVGGAQLITLKPPSSYSIGRINYETRPDYSGYHKINLFLSGPLYKVTKDGTEDTKIGYRLSGSGTTYGDATYNHRNSYRSLKEDVRKAISEKPLVVQEDGSLDFATNYLRADDFENINRRPGNRTWFGYVEGALNFRISPDITLDLSGEYSYSNSNSSGGFPINDVYKSRTIGNSYTFAADFTHRFPNKETKPGEASPTVKNLMYTILASYSSTSSSTFNPDLKNDFFRYGYVGQFIPHYSNPGTDEEGNSYVLTKKNIWGEEIYVYEQQKGLPKIDSISFVPNLQNPLHKYTSQLYELMYPNPLTNLKDQIGGNTLKGAINGGNPANVYGLFQNINVPYQSYSKAQSNYIYFQAKASADIKNHSIEFGFQYDQSTYRSFNLSAANLWTLMRDDVNTQIKEHEDTDSIDVSGQDIYIRYKRKYDAEAQTHFDRKLREKLGYAVDGLNWIDVDSQDPGIYSLDMFSADELYRSGNNPLVSYYGYDHTGKITRGKSSIDDYFGEFGNRALGAWSPIYMAGYIQDRFYFSDLIFNVGVRVDRYDGNQMVLKDPYLLYPSYTAGEVSELMNKKVGKHPDGIGSDYVVYVNKLSSDINSMEITGYRQGSTWYNAEGIQVADPYEIKGDNPQPTPYRKKIDTPEITSESFKKYDPQFVVMPRIAFSFPVSDKSQFKASYDIIARRPSGGWQAPYFNYMFMTQVPSTSVINNPDLKPEKVTNYELGFQQALNTSSAITITAYFKETRDLISIIQNVGADPNPNIFTFGNFDYKTTKGVSIAYDLRRSKNIRLSANYTLQYAESTTLPQSTMRALMMQGYPNLKILSPIGSDNRHEFKVDFDFRYGMGKEYNGPKTTKRIVENGVEKSKTTLWLQNAGAHVTAAALSGGPYTRLKSWTESTIVGGYNSGRLPWQFFITLQLDKAWVFTKASTTGKVSSGGRHPMLTVYARAQNLLDLKNIVGVYSRTGDPEDNGYLTDPGTQADIRNQVNELSYRDMYAINLMNASIGNYSSPRTITLGIAYSF